MANELIINHSSGSTLYALLFDATGNVWNGSSFAAPASASWTDYDIAMTEVATATGIYRASMPAAAAGVYGWAVRKQAGASPAVGDIVVGVGRIEWSGTAEIMPASTTNIEQINSVSGNIGGDVAGKVLGGGSGVFVDDGVQVASSGALTAQQTADAVNNLAPASTGAAGSIRDKLDAIKTTTNNIDVSAVTYVAASNAGHLTITSGLTFDESVENLIIPVDWETAYFTIKQSPSDFEEESIVQLIESNPGSLEDGLLRLNAVLWHEAVIDDILTEEIDETSPEPFSQSIGSLFVNQGAGSVRIYLTDELTTLLSPYKRIGWDVKFIDSSGDSTGKRGVVDIIKTETHTT